MKTDITMILDRSGSMRTIASDAIGGVNNFIQEQKKVEGEASFTFVQFDDRYEVVYDDVNLKEVEGVELQPRGMTALLDAVGKTIKKTQKRLNTGCQSCKPDKVIFVIITDGYENASTKFTQQDIAKMIKHQQDKHGWDFVFLGANQDSFTVAQQFNIKPQFVSNYCATSDGVGLAMKTVTQNMSTYRCSTKNDAFFSEDDQETLENSK